MTYNTAAPTNGHVDQAWREQIPLERACREIRRTADWSQARLGRLAHIPPSALIDFENGERILKPRTEARLIAALSVLCLQLVLELLRD